MGIQPDLARAFPGTSFRAEQGWDGMIQPGSMGNSSRAGESTTALAKVVLRVVNGFCWSGESGA